MSTGDVKDEAMAKLAGLNADAEIVKINESIGDVAYRRKVSISKSDECPVWDSSRGVFTESDAQFRARIRDELNADEMKKAGAQVLTPADTASLGILQGAIDRAVDKLQGVKQPGLDPTTDAIAAQNRTRDRMFDAMKSASLALNGKAESLVELIEDLPRLAMDRMDEICHLDAALRCCQADCERLEAVIGGQREAGEHARKAFETLGKIRTALKIAPTADVLAAVRNVENERASLRQSHTEWRAAQDKLRAELIAAQTDIRENDHAMKVVDAADKRAREMWNEAHASTPIAFPDRARTIVWLLEQLDSVTAEADRQRKRADDIETKYCLGVEMGTVVATLKAEVGKPYSMMFDRFKAELEEPLRKEIERLRAAAIDDHEQIVKLKSDREIRDVKLAELRERADEFEQNRRQIDALTKQRDFHEGRFNEASHRHDEASAALAAMTIKWLTLENATKRDVSNLFDAINKTSADLKAARAEVEELKQAQANHERHNGDLAAARILIRKCLDALPPKMRESYGRAKLPDAIAGLVAMRDAWEKTSDDLSEQLRVADGDRIPLAQDLQIVRSDLKTAKESIGRMADYIGKAERVSNSWRHAQIFGTDLRMALGDQVEAADAYETACAQAANESADPSQEEMPF